jgi:hypothetical protein
MLSPKQIPLFSTSLTGDVHLQHALYVLKHLMGSRKVLDANKFMPIHYISGLVCTLLLGESGGLFIPMLIQKPSSFFSEDYKCWAVFISWFVFYQNYSTEFID